MIINSISITRHAGKALSEEHAENVVGHGVQPIGTAFWTKHSTHNRRKPQRLAKWIHSTQFHRAWHAPPGFPQLHKAKCASPDASETYICYTLQRPRAQYPFPHHHSRSFKAEALTMATNSADRKNSTDFHLESLGTDVAVDDPVITDRATKEKALLRRIDIRMMPMMMIICMFWSVPQYRRPALTQISYQTY